MNAGLRDRLTLDEARTLETLNGHWGAVYRVSYDGSRWQASRKDRTGETLRGLTADDLAAGMRAGRTARHPTAWHSFRAEGSNEPLTGTTPRKLADAIREAWITTGSAR